MHALVGDANCVVAEARMAEDLCTEAAAEGRELGVPMLQCARVVDVVLLVVLAFKLTAVPH